MDTVILVEYGWRVKAHILLMFTSKQTQKRKMDATKLRVVLIEDNSQYRLFLSREIAEGGVAQVVYETSE